MVALLEMTPADLTFPGMAVTIDHPGDQDGAAGVDDDRVLRGGAEVRCDRGDLLALDEQVAAHEVAHRRVHRDDGGALEQDAAARVADGPLQAIEGGGIDLPHLGSGAVGDQRHGPCPGGDRRPGLEDLAPGTSALERDIRSGRRSFLSASVRQALGVHRCLPVTLTTPDE